MGGFYVLRKAFSFEVRGFYKKPEIHFFSTGFWPVQSKSPWMTSKSLIKVKAFLLSLTCLRGRKIKLTHISSTCLLHTECLNFPMGFFFKKVWHRPFADISEINAQSCLLNFLLIKRFTCYYSGEYYKTWSKSYFMMVSKYLFTLHSRIFLIEQTSEENVWCSSLCRTNFIQDGSFQISQAKLINFTGQSQHISQMPHKKGFRLILWKSTQAQTLQLHSVYEREL